MATTTIKISQFENYFGGAGWQGAVNSPTAGYPISAYGAWDNADTGSNDYIVSQIKFAASSFFSTVTVNSVTLWLKVDSNNAYSGGSYGDEVYLNASNTNHLTTSYSGTNFGNLTAGTGWKSFNITSLFAGLSSNTDDWYILLFAHNSAGYYTTSFFVGDESGNEAYISIDFTGNESACTAPSSVTVSNETPAPSADVTLFWSGAEAGDWNNIVGYDIYRATSSSGTYQYLKSVATSATYGSTSVTAHSVPGTTYYYKVLTKGAAGESYYSGLSSQYASVTATSTECVAPSVLSLSATVTATNPILSWGGAYAGQGNAITGYDIQYSDSDDDSTWGSWTALKTLYTSNTSGNTIVAINPTLGSYRRYRIMTLGTLEGYDSDWSEASASVRTKSSTVSGMQTPKIVVYEYPHVVSNVEYGPYALDMVNRFHTLIWRRKYQGVGEFALIVPFDENANELLDCGNLIGIAGRNELMLITTKIIDEDDEGNEIITLTGKSMAAMLGMRVVTSSTQSEDGPVGQILSMLRAQKIFCEHYNAGSSMWVNDINANLYADSYGDRRFPDFHWQEPAFTYATDDDIIYQPEKLTSMLDSVISLCKVRGCGLRVTSEYYSSTANTLTMYFELFMGVDRSTGQDENPHVVFDEALGNIIRQTYTNSIENQKTAGYATNGAIDTLSAADLRLVDIMSENNYSSGDQAYINDGTPTANVNGGSGMNRNEIGLSVSEIEEPTSGTNNEKIQVLYDSCKQIGRNEIEKSSEEHAFDVVINANVGQQYLSDYNLGDIVTVRNSRYGISMDAVIAETEETYEPGKNMQVALTLGNPVISLIGRMKQISRRRG